MWATKTTDGPQGTATSKSNWADYCLDRLKPYGPGSSIRMDWNVQAVPGVQAPLESSLLIESDTRDDLWRGTLTFPNPNGKGKQTIPYHGRTNCEQAVRAAVGLAAEGGGNLHLVCHGHEYTREKLF